MFEEHNVEHTYQIRTTQCLELLVNAKYGKSDIFDKYFYEMFTDLRPHVEYKTSKEIQDSILNLLQQQGGEN